MCPSILGLGCTAPGPRYLLLKQLNSADHRPLCNSTVVSVLQSGRCTGALQHAAWETARLRVRATALAAENDALKTHVSQLMQQISDMDRNVQVRLHVEQSCALRNSHLSCACPLRTPPLGMKALLISAAPGSMLVWYMQQRCALNRACNQALSRTLLRGTLRLCSSWAHVQQMTLYSPNKQARCPACPPQ